MKWDTFIGRKGGMNNTLLPVTTSTNTNGTSTTTFHTELPRPPKLDEIPAGKRDEPPKPVDQSRSIVPIQQERQVHDDHHHAEQEANLKDLLKGKPIIFVGGGPGMKITI